MENLIAALVFPGQGTQKTGMGKDFFDNISTSRETYQQAADALGWDVSAMCFEEDERLNLTEYAQPCILTTEIAMLRGIQEKHDFFPEYFSGHSLGEYTALVAAGVIPLEVALKIVQIRGRLMQNACPSGTGAMAAIISENLNIEAIRSALQDRAIDVANINSSDQIVISGNADDMKTAEKRIKEVYGGDKPLRFILLNVSAPFHSRFMESIGDEFGEVLNSFRPQIRAENADKVTSNFTGSFHTKLPEEIISKLVSQLSGSVQWCKNMEVLIEKTENIWEIGPNRPLKGFFQSMGTKCRSITNLKTAEKELPMKN
ncbi:ACP S-malonyltransferase [bacterium]|nr:ACP S-malonyltransferase [bacterium]